MSENNQLENILFKVTSEEYGENYQNDLLSLYKLCVEMADRVSHRRQLANSFYLSVNAALLSLTGFIGTSTALHPILLVLAGIFTSTLWIRNIQTYKDLNDGKFYVINQLESKLAAQPFNTEWAYLKRGKEKSFYRPFHKVEVLVPILFILVYVVFILFQLPWHSLILSICTG